MPGDTNQNYTSVHRAITEVWDGPQDNFVLVYGNSNKDTYNAIAFQIARAVRRVERITDAFSMNDNTAVDWGWFGENGFSQDVSDPGKELFRIAENRGSTIIEYGVAVPNDGVYVGVQLGDGDTVNGFREGDDRDRGIAGADLSQRAGVLSDHTYVDTPTTSTQDVIPTTAVSEAPNQGLIRLDSQERGPNRMYFAFDNQSGGNVAVDVIAHGMTYDIRPIQDEQTVKEMLRDRGYDARKLTWGGFGNQNPNLPTNWVGARVDIGPNELVPPA